MTSPRLCTSIFLMLASVAFSASAQKKPRLGDNAALRYWAAFSVMQDSGISSEQAKEMNAILEGTAPYDDLKYRELVEKNRLALEIMARATALPSCDWGLDYALGEEVPVEYARNALALGRLNVLYVFHLLLTGNKGAAVEALVSGLRLSRDVANGGSLFATLAAKDLLENHLRAISFARHKASLSAGQRLQLQKAVVQLGTDPLDWQAAARRDLEGLRGQFAGDPQASAALTQIVSSYLSALNDPSQLPALQQLLGSTPKQMADLIPNAKRVLEQKQDLREKLTKMRLVLR